MSAFDVVPAHQLPVQPPDRRWLIRDLWSTGAVGIVGGEPKCGKSFLALGMAVAVAAGRPCLGRFEVPHPGRVLLYAAEDALHLVRERLAAIAAHHGVDLATLDLGVITAPVIRLDTAEHCHRLQTTVAKHTPTLLILDPFVRLHRVDENVSAAVAPLLAFLRELQRQHGCAVVVVHHTRKNPGTARPGQTLRGSSELHAWGDSNLYLRRIRDRITLAVEHRAHPAIPDLTLQLQVTTAGTALVAVDPASTTDTGASTESSLPLPDRILQALGQLDHAAHLRELRDGCRVRNATLCQVLLDLEHQGRIVRADGGWTLAAIRRPPAPQLPDQQPRQQITLPLPVHG